MRYPIWPALALLIAGVSKAADLQHLHSLADTRYHHVESEVIGRAYHVYINTPHDYDEADDRLYPTVYILDSGELFPMFASYYRYLNFGEEIPDAMPVGISYGGDTAETGNYRSTDYTAPSEERDYWGGATDFQTFLRTELLPLVERSYRSDPERRVIFGQSIGGQFVLYTAMTQPELFWGHIASNPALHRNLDFFLERHSYSQETGHSKLFVGSGTLDDRQFRVPAKEWMDHWNARTKKPWKLKTVDLDGQTHMSAPPVSFREGMRWLFYGD